MEYGFYHIVYLYTETSYYFTLEKWFPYRASELIPLILGVFKNKNREEGETE